MKKSSLALALAGAFAAPAFAQTAAPAAEAEASPHTLTANVGLFSEYRFRGIAQRSSRPAFQGGFDYSHASGFYVGNWNSNVDASAGLPDGNIEMDFYGGYKAAFGDFGVDVGGIYYYYPGSSYVPGGRSQAETVTNKEFYLGASRKFISAKWYYSVNDYFSMRGRVASSKRQSSVIALVTGGKAMESSAWLWVRSVFGTPRKLSMVNLKRQSSLGRHSSTQCPFMCLAGA